MSDYTLYEGDCIEVMASMDANSKDAIATDPPAGINFMSRNWDNLTGHGAKTDRGRMVAPALELLQAAGTLQAWEAGFLLFTVDWASEALRVAKPGAHSLTWALPRSSDLTKFGLRLAGWEIRDTVYHLFGSGFPKSADVSKMIDSQEKNKWLYMCKAIDNFDKMSIINEWKKYSRSAKYAELTLPKNQIETGMNTPKSDFVHVSAALPASQEKSIASAIIAELNFSEVPHTRSGTEVIIAPMNAGGKEKPDLVKFAESQPRNGQARFINTGIVQCNVRESLKERTADNLRGVEALKIWLGKSKSSKPAHTNALCAALTDDLKRIILSQSKTFLSLGTSQQTDFVSAISVTITESTAESLISYTVDTLRLEAIDKIRGAEREVIGNYDSRGVYDGFDRPSNGEYTGGITNNHSWGQTAITAPATPEAQQWAGWGSALKPAVEEWILARKPIDSTIAANVLEWGTGGLNIDACRVPISDGAKMARNNKPGDNGWKNSSGGQNSAALNGEPSGRWPANLIHDGSDEVLAGFPVTTNSNKFTVGGSPRKTDGFVCTGSPDRSSAIMNYGDTGSAARYFFCAKASRSDRSSDGEVDNDHPTVKSRELMSYLCKLICPPGGTILDPFMGSGSTGVAARELGFAFVGIEQDAHNLELARRRIDKTHRSVSGLARKVETANHDDLPLFALESES
ncbi:MAG TPA: DNA methyltransferase [Pseudomonadales bacterium]|nr:DNA methyltransferase [Pseudomonadales bacterium]